MRFGDLTYEQIREHAVSGAVVFVPLGCTEQQGPHLPVDFDTMMVTAMALAIADRVEETTSRIVLVLPTVPFGPTPEHAGFGAGYVNLRQTTHEAIARDVLDSIAAQGFETIVIWRGCGQHDLTTVVAEFNETAAGARAWQPMCDYPRISDEAFGRRVAGGHADSFATSICMLLRPEAVREGRIAMPVQKPFTWSDQVDFSAISDNGVVGDPTAASREAGGRLWDLIVEEGARITRDIVEGRGDNVRQSWQLRDDSP